MPDTIVLTPKIKISCQIRWF